MTVTDKQGGPRPLHALVGDDKLAAWSDEDKTKLEALEAELERDGPIAVERMREKDPVFFVQLAYDCGLFAGGSADAACGVAGQAARGWG
jgi:hypothetical protein